MLNKIEDPKARQAYINHRRGSMQVMLSLFTISKIIHIVHVSIALSKADLIEHRLEKASILANYPVYDNDGVFDEESKD